jgi:hypothetical protein
MTAMADEEVVNVLREIRDLQKMHIELYKNALSNQQAAIEMQKNAVRRQKFSVAVLLIIVFVCVALLVAQSMIRR